MKGFFMAQYVVTAAVRMLDLSPIWHTLAIRGRLDTCGFTHWRPYQKSASRAQWIPRFVCRVSGLAP